ncbi:MAG: leucine-rich repeat domain-containing protein [Treponema sp.]
MQDITIKKNGLVYTEDMKTVLGVDEESTLFSGTVPNGADAVGAEAFTCCKFTRVSLPESIKHVGDNLFSNSEKLEWVHLPSSLKQLAPYMFSGCTSLIHVDMPVEINEFPEGLFYGCSSLQEIPFRYGITVLPENVFARCSSIVSLAIPDTVKKICKGAISDCENLQTIVFPEKLEELEEGAISGCPKLIRMRIQGDNSLFYTNPKGDTLFKKSAGGDIEVFKITKRFSEAAKLKVEEDANNSIIDFEDSDDDNEIVESVETSKNNGDSERENIINKQDKAMSNEDKNETSVSISNEELLAARMAEIMEKDKNSGASFSISDIPEATEEELNAEILASPKKTNTSDDDSSITEAAEEKIESPNTDISADSDIDSKLANILTQDKQYSLNFSISDIPEATEEEIAAEVLAPAHSDNSSEEKTLQQEDDSPASSHEENISEEAEEDIPAENDEDSVFSNHAAVTEEEEAALATEPDESSAINSRLADILTQDKQFSSGFSISDIPEATEEELSAEILSPSSRGDSEEDSVQLEAEEKSPDSPAIDSAHEEVIKKAAAIVDEHIIETSGGESEAIVAVEPPPVMQVNPVIEENEQAFAETFDEKNVMQNLFFESAKVMQKNTGIDADKNRILFVFADNLCDGTVGKVFSSRLVSCCERLSKIHNFTSVYYFHGIKLENEKFRKQFKQLMRNKDAVYAVSESSLSELSDAQKTFSENAGIKIDGESMATQIANAANPDVECLKLLLQDILE